MQKRLDRLEKVISMLQKRHCPERDLNVGVGELPSTTRMECDTPLPSIESDETDDDKYDKRSLERKLSLSTS